MSWAQLVLIPLAIGLGGVATLIILGMFSWRRPTGLGLTDGRLSPCPPTPNCVCTQAADAIHRIDPIPFQGSGAEALARLKTVLAQRPRVAIVSATGAYLHAEFTSPVFRFVDDVEFLIDETAHLIHFRSASRIGRSDLGANRARMERLRQLIGG